MNAVFAVTIGLLVVGAALTFARLLRGPTVYDRLVALDTLVVIVVSGVAVDAAFHRDSANVLLLVAVALVGFVSTLAVVRLMPENRR